MLFHHMKTVSCKRIRLTCMLLLHASGAFLKCLHGVRHDIACCAHVSGGIPLLSNVKLQMGIKALIIHYLNDYTSI